MTNSNIKLLSAIVAAIALAYTPVSLVAPAHAYDDDVEVVKIPAVISPPAASKS